MTMQYVQVRPVTQIGDADGERMLVRAFEGDDIFAWGLYATDADGLPMHEEDYDTREGAVAEGRIKAQGLGVSLAIDELDGTTSWIN